MWKGVGGSLGRKVGGGRKVGRGMEVERAVFEDGDVFLVVVLCSAATSSWR